ncbi:MAG: ribosomal protein S18-alanine N-acetyltransferase [Alphaproteobacteria bacterium]|nr:ribosomal protein S18-alanine N-acetyltransferase [Alphaproteobacteria bacterium]
MSATSVLSLAEGSVRDLDSVMQVMHDSFDPAYGEAWTGPQCAGLLPMPGVWLSLARLGPSVAGFALARIVAGEAELLLLAVAGGAQRRGVGTSLLKHFIDLAKGRGASRLHLEVRDGNPALSLYRSAGFEEVGRRRNYYHGEGGRLYDALTLARRA